MEKTKEKKYITTKEQCKNRIDKLKTVCPQCGGILTPIETVDNINRPTYWSGCVECSIFTNGCAEDVYNIAVKMVDERNFVAYKHMECYIKEKQPEKFDYWRKSQIGGAVSVVEDILKIKEEYANQKQPTPTDEKTTLHNKRVPVWSTDCTECTKGMILLYEKGAYAGCDSCGKSWETDYEDHCELSPKTTEYWLTQPTEQLPFEEMDEKRYQLIYSAIPSMVDIIHISDHTREEIANCINGVLGNYQPTEQQNEKHLDEEIIQKLAGMLNEKMIHPEKDVYLLLEELQNIGLFFNEDDPYWYSDGE